MLNVLVFGGSRNIGYFTALRLLKQGATVTFLLRSLRVFDSDTDIRHFVALGKAKLIEGDALNPDDVKAAWDQATTIHPENPGVDFVLFTVGGTPSFKVSKGFVIDPPNLCTQCLLNVLCTMPKLPAPPKYIVLTSIGLTEEAHHNLPLLLKPLYGYLLTGPHEDKYGAERVAAHCVGREWTEREPKPEVMSGPLGNWSDRGRLPEKGSIKEFVVVRPAMLTDGECKADKAEGAYKVSEQYLRDGYRVSRKDVGHFIATRLFQEWSEWEGKIIHIAY